MIKTADYIIDMGPEGETEAVPWSLRAHRKRWRRSTPYTGYYVNKMLERDKARRRGK